eukprot:TRINITY_DN8702_c0_g1_i1.p1 TRINITY_DN8702_c0_g1~~TRINITY_DN8702_c0_g1_i1.p1  ORF type:complete len:153 (+),score=20.23 TRINITY_DN8702_c0_g1_i1:124-582(+)
MKIECIVRTVLAHTPYSFVTKKKWFVTQMNMFSLQHHQLFATTAGKKRHVQKHELPPETMQQASLNHVAVSPATGNLYAEQCLQVTTMNYDSLSDTSASRSVSPNLNCDENQGFGSYVHSLGGFFALTKCNSAATVCERWGGFDRLCLYCFE